MSKPKRLIISTILSQRDFNTVCKRISDQPEVCVYLLDKLKDSTFRKIIVTLINKQQFFDSDSEESLLSDWKVFIESELDEVELSELYRVVPTGVISYLGDFIMSVMQALFDYGVDEIYTEQVEDIEIGEFGDVEVSFFHIDIFSRHL